MKALQYHRTLATVLSMIFLFLASASCQTGWGARPAQTLIQKRIVSLAKPAGSSGPSAIQTSYSQGCDGRGWCTDTSNGDGPRIRAAISRYSRWYSVRPRTETLASVMIRMKNDLQGPLYSDASKTILVQQIVNVFTGQVPATDSQTLQFLNIRKQCLEWAMTTAMSAGGAARDYRTQAVTNPQQWRPGMGLYRMDNAHAMII